MLGGQGHAGRERFKIVVSVLHPEPSHPSLATIYSFNLLKLLCWRYCLDEVFESCDSVQSAQWKNSHNQKRCLCEPDLAKKKSLSHGSILYIGSRETGVWTGLRGLWGLAACKALSQHPFCLSFADERDRVQKKTFTKWVNKHLMKVGFFHMFPKLFLLCVSI